VRWLIGFFNAQANSGGSEKLKKENMPLRLYTTSKNIFNAKFLQSLFSVTSFAFSLK
jgi:hypothetical protein